MILNQVNEATQAVEALKVMMDNPWLLTFLGLFLLGWLLKEHTKLPNKLIPWLLTLAGGVLGMFLIEWTIAGAIIGCAIAYIIMAFYEKIKNTIEFYKESHLNK